MYGIGICLLKMRCNMTYIDYLLCTKDTRDLVNGNHMDDA